MDHACGSDGTYRTHRLMLSFSNISRGSRFWRADTEPTSVSCFEVGEFSRFHTTTVARLMDRDITSWYRPWRNAVRKKASRFDRRI